MKHRLFIYITTLLCAIISHAQSNSEIRVSEGGYGLIKTNVTVAYDHTFGKVTDGFNARVSYEFLKKRHITLTGNFKYNSLSCDFDQSDLSVSLNPDKINLNGIHTMEQIGVTATSNTRLFGKPLLGIGMVNSEWGKGGFNRVSASIMAMIMLRANRNTQFGIGLMGILNTTSKVPVFPVFVYRHRFNPKLLLNLYGAMFGLDFTPTASDLLSLGADVDVKSFYFRPSTEELPKTCRYTQTNFRPMLKYRRKLIPNLHFDAQAGYAINMSSRVNGINGTKEYLKLSQRPHPFIQCSMSYSL